MKAKTTRLPVLDPASATDEQRAPLERVLEQTGIVPALLRVMAHSPAMLEGYLSMQERLEGGALDKRLRYQIALAVSQANGSEYCVAAYTALGRAVGLSEEAMRDARAASSPDRRTDVSLKLARALASRCDVSARDHLPRVVDAGLGPAEIVELVAHVMIVSLVNALYHLSAVAVDFPPVDIDEIDR